MPEAMGEGGSAARKAVFQRSGERGRLQESAPVGMNSRDSLAALNEMTAVQALRLYSVSGADGRLRYLGVEKRRPADGHKQPEFTSAVE